MSECMNCADAEHRCAMAERERDAAVIRAKNAEEGRDTLRARLREFEPRALRDGDEWTFDEDKYLIYSAEEGFEGVMPSPSDLESAMNRIVRIPVPSAEAKPEENIVLEAFGVAGERQLVGLDDAMLGIPEHIINAPPQHVTATQLGLTMKPSAKQNPAPWLGDCEPAAGADPPNALQGLFLVNAENRVLSLRAALIETIRNSSEVDTVRRAALALIGEAKP